MTASHEEAVRPRFSVSPFARGALLLALAVPGPASAAVPAANRTRPKLIVLLVVDQMRGDYVERYGGVWTQGLRRIFADGARFPEAAYPYLATVTCAGHATIATGTFPSTHGVVSNAWWDRETSRYVTCTEDPDARIVSYGQPSTGGDSARRLASPTLAEELRIQFGAESRSVTVSLTPRSSIMLAGHRGDAVTWFDSRSGSWLTSSAYIAAPLPFLQEFLKAHPVDADYGKAWLRQLPASAYLYEDAVPDERPLYGWSASFPHPLSKGGGLPDADFYAAWGASPYSDAYLGQMAAAAVDALNLGQGKGIDFLGVSFSALDSVGHSFGPRSHEVQDILAGLDATIGALLARLDKTVGAGRYVVALSADHGVAPIPEQVTADGVPAGRIVADDVAATLEKALQPYFGAGPHVANVSYTDVYLASGLYPRLAANRGALEAARHALLAIPGVFRVLTSDDVREPRNDVARAAALNFSERASGDFILVPRPYWIHVRAEEGKVPTPGPGTTHGTNHLYDRRVPVAFFGAGIRPGEYLGAATPADIAPTLAYLAGLTPAATDGRILVEALAR
jgi:predicted AlkP superfamily pyrophosphatase or phosphodiesterase